jgi:putative SOS response-associated peptidase YedK
MCGRFSLNIGPKFDDRFGLGDHLELAPKYEATPGQILPIILKNNVNQVGLMKWGIGQNLFNARAETITEKFTFKHLVYSQRCLVPASGFFEWQKTPSKKIPFYFSLKDVPLFAFAGLFDNSTFTIITTAPNDLVAPIHDRMPVILPQSQESLWLDPQSDIAQVLPLLQPYPASEMSLKQL